MRVFIKTNRWKFIKSEFFSKQYVEYTEKYS